MVAVPTPPDINFPIPADLIEHVSFTGVLVHRMQQSSIAALETANATIAQLQSALAAKDTAMTELYDKYLALVTTNNQQSQKLLEASRRIAELEKQPVPPVIVEPVPPPVVVPPVVSAVKPVITKERFENLVIGCIVKIGDAGTEDAMVREIIDKSVELGCNSVTAWFHPTVEVAKYLRPENVNDALKNPFKYATDRGVIIGADTIDAALRILPETVTDEVFNKYIDSLIALGAKYLLWNDVDGIRDGKRVYPPEAIQTGMARIKRALKEHANIPVIASLTAGANLNDYRTVYGFDFVEIQTDGNLTELGNFMKLPADVFALFVEQDKSLDYLNRARPLVVNSGAKAIRIYALYDEDTDFRKSDMQTRAVEVEKTVKALTAQWQPVQSPA